MHKLSAKSNADLPVSVHQCLLGFKAIAEGRNDFWYMWIMSLSFQLGFPECVFVVLSPQLVQIGLL